MSSTYLCGVDIFGKTYLLSTSGQFWIELKGQQLEMKRLSAVHQCAWGLGCDHQVYTYVYSTDVPIRYQVETYENQRWNPVDGFTSKKLLFSDRWQWSNEKGTKYCPKDKVKLPSEHWSWEGDWYVDENMKGEVTGKGGWQYAVDFKRRYTVEQRWNSCVRRRRWIRYRRYHASDTWAKIPSPFDDPLQEPFIDISVGGYDLAGQVEGHLLVWAVTVQGKVFVRRGIRSHCPEGTHWMEVETEDGRDAVQISVGPTGLVWVVLRDGMAAVWFRKGIHAIKAYIDSFAELGLGWVEMVGNMLQVSVGPNDQVWALGYEDRTLYFRTGVTSAEPYGKTWKVIECKEQHASSMYCNSSTTSLVTLLHSISMSEIYENKQQAEFTKGLIESISAGKLSRSLEDESSPFVNSCDSLTDGYAKKVEFFMSEDEDMKRTCTRKRTGSSPSYGYAPYWDMGSLDENKSAECTQPEQSHIVELLQSSKTCDRTDIEKFTDDPSRLSSACSVSIHGNDDVKNSEEINDHGSKENLFMLEESCVYPDHCRETGYISDASDTVIDFVSDFHSDDDKEAIKFNSNLESVSFHKTAGAKTAIADDKNQISNCTQNLGAQIPNLTSEGHVSIDSFHRTLSDLCQYYSSGDVSWVCVSGGGCFLDPQSLPNWFSQPRSSISGDSVQSMSAIYRNKIANGEWRLSIFRKLQERNVSEVTGYESYTPAVERTSWVKRGCMLWWHEQKPFKWFDCSVELEQGVGVKIQDSTLTVYYHHHGKSRHVQLPLSEITCVLKVNGPDSRCNKSVFAVITAKRTVKRKPLRLAANSHEEMEDWLSAISMSCCDVKGLRLAPSNMALWITSCHGDIFFHEPCPDIETMPCNEMYWCQMGGHMSMVECCPAGVVWAIGYDNTAWVYSGGYGGGPFKGVISHTAGIHKQTDCKNMYMYQNQRWNPIYGFTDRGFPGELMTSGDSSAISNHPQQVKLPSPHWQWGSNWLHVPTDGPFQCISVGGGYRVWGIAKDGSVYLRNGINPNNVPGDCWFHISPPHVPLKQLSAGKTSVFAVDINDGLWFRKDITRTFPEGTTWIHICNNVFKVSVGPQNQVWILAAKVDASRKTVCRRLGVSSDNPKGTTWDLGIG
uniref:Tectonin beta-propeller repeat-containing protein 1 n=1 Tax=Saccoglossus kowalevskii TaxID=10224 RepID=A0ABM0LVI4_SACKO